MAYERYIQTNKISVQVVELPGDLGRTEIQRITGRGHRSWAYLESKGGSISRVVVAVSHPEAFRRAKSVEHTAQSRYYALQERLIDLVNIMAFGSVHYPALLTSADYLVSYKSGMIIPKTLLGPGYETEQMCSRKERDQESKICHNCSMHAPVLSCRYKVIAH